LLFSLLADHCPAHNNNKLPFHRVHKMFCYAKRNKNWIELYCSLISFYFIRRRRRRRLLFYGELMRKWASNQIGCCFHRKEDIVFVLGGGGGGTSAAAVLPGIGLSSNIIHLSCS
jgi:hypothetical protein